MPSLTVVNLCIQPICTMYRWATKKEKQMSSKVGKNWFPV